MGQVDNEVDYGLYRSGLEARIYNWFLLSMLTLAQWARW